MIYSRLYSFNQNLWTFNQHLWTVDNYGKHSRDIFNSYTILYAILDSILAKILNLLYFISSLMLYTILYSILYNIHYAIRYTHLYTRLYTRLHATSASLPATPKYFILPPRASRLHQNILYYLREPPGDPPTTTFNVGPRDPDPRAPTNRAPLAPIGRNRKNFEPNHYFWAKVWYIRPVHERSPKSKAMSEMPV